MSASKVLEVRDVKRAFGERTIIHNISFTVRSGETLFIKGASGVGKSLLLRALAYLDPLQVATRAIIFLHALVMMAIPCIPIS